jgi:hypothetical protein
MEAVLLVLLALACPLGMLAMGGIAWVSARAFGGHSNRFTRMTERASCMPGHRQQSADSAGEATL